ncbi:MAG: hypothetical protein U1D55_17255 [Phycisphaerae bacterium]
MSAIPPNSVTSIAQSQAAAARNADTKQRADADKQARETPFAHAVRDMIESADRDSQVYSDAEGAGGQGRSRGDAGPESEPAHDEQRSGEQSELDIQA